MKALHVAISTCRRCQFYTPEGRRGGHCRQLQVPVGGSWTACSLALPPFAPSWERLEGAIRLPSKMKTASEAISEMASEVDLTGRDANTNKEATKIRAESLECARELAKYSHIEA